MPSIVESIEQKFFSFLSAFRSLEFVLTVQPLVPKIWHFFFSFLSSSVSKYAFEANESKQLTHVTNPQLGILWLKTSLSFVFLHGWCSILLCALCDCCNLKVLIVEYSSQKTKNTYWRKLSHKKQRNGWYIAKFTQRSRATNGSFSDFCFIPTYVVFFGLIHRTNKRRECRSASFNFTHASQQKKRKFVLTMVVQHF